MLEYLLGVQLSSEVVTILLQVLTLNVQLPTFSKDVLDSLEIGVELSLKLTGPDDGSRDGRQITQLTHVVRLRLVVLLLELVVQRRDILLHPLDELSLILLDGSLDLSSVRTTS